MRYLINIMLAIAGAVVALVIGESILIGINFEYHLYPSSIQFGYPDPVSLAHYFSPDSDLFWVGKDYQSRLNQLKGIHPEILFMGDSCTAFGDYHARLIHQIESPAHPIPYGTLGEAGYSTYQGAEQFQRDAVPLHPRIVTFYYGWNDHWERYGMTDKQMGTMKSLPVESLDLFKSGQLILKTVYHLNFSSDKKVVRVPLPEFKQNLEHLVATARANNIVPVLMTAPTSHRPGHEPDYLKTRWISDLSQLVPLHRSYVDAVRAVGTETGTVVCDLFENFHRLPESERAQSFQQDGIHLTAEGNQRTAEYLRSCLEQNHLLSLL